MHVFRQPGSLHLDELEAVGIFQSIGLTMAMLGLVAVIIFAMYQVYKVGYESYILN